MDMLAVGLAIGLAAGVSPGPLLVLVVTQTLRSGWRAGLLTAAAPLLSDVLVVGGTLLVLRQLPERGLALLGLIGGGYVIRAGVQTWREAEAGLPRSDGQAVAALRRAVTVNLLSPHPWVTWATALGPLTVAAWRRDPGVGVALVGGFYIALVGTKAALALLTAGGRRRLGDLGYRRTARAGALLLAVAGAALAVESLSQALRG